MADKFPYFAAETGTYSTTGPSVSLSGTAASLGVYPARTFAAAAADTSIDFDSTHTCSVTIAKDASNYKRYTGAVWTDASPDTIGLSSAVLEGSAGTISDSDSVTVYGTFPTKLVQANTHESPDTDAATTSLHHTIGTGANQAAAGNHGHSALGNLTLTATQDTATLGSELVTNGTFDTDLTGWTAGANWAQSSGTAAHTAGSTETLTQTISESMTLNAIYLLSVTVTRGAGSIVPSFGTSPGGPVSAYSGSTTYKTAFKYDGGSKVLTFTPSSTFSGSIASVSLKPLVANSYPVVTINHSGSSLAAIESRSGGDGQGNTYFGIDSGKQDVVNVDCTAVGYHAQELTCVGYFLTAVGARTQQNAVSAEHCSAFGAYSQYGLTSGYRNVSYGGYSGYSLKKSSYNVGVGISAHYYLSNGNYNVSLGDNAASFIANGITANTTFNNCIHIGALTKSLADGQDNQIVIGYSATGLGANTTVIGNSSTTAAKIWGSLEITGPLKTGGYTVATLPVGTVGHFAYVTDAASPTAGTAVTGGGSLTVRVFYNGSAWVVADTHSHTDVLTTSNADFMAAQLVSSLSLGAR